jgi:two-component system sensor histidine kinase PhoQ
MKHTSLRRHFFFNSAIVVIAVMIISALLVDISYRHELEKSEQEKLKLHIFNLISVTSYQNGETVLPIVLSNPKFNTPDSDLWAVVLNNQKVAIWQSLSMDNLPTQFSAQPKLGQWQYGKQVLNNHTFFTTSYTIQWGRSTFNNPTDKKQESNKNTARFHFIVGQQVNKFDDAVQGFRLWLFLGFIAFTTLLLAIQYLVLKFSFKPINMLGDEIKKLENGEQSKLNKHYPSELESVTNNLNMLIEKEYKQREKYRAAMADLAHSLKTPISIITAEVAQYPSNMVLSNALSRINNTIEYQLRRAVISGHNLLTKGTNISATLSMVLMALEKIYKDSNIIVSTDIDPVCLFMGDENDLLEIFGNLIDNSFKHADSKIIIKGRNDDDALIISVEDDGDGVPEDKINDIFKRGTRLDETVQGQGIGLSIVDNIVSSYDGELILKRSKLGGALFIIRFKKNTQGTQV